MTSTSRAVLVGATVVSLFLNSAFGDGPPLSEQAVAGEYAIGQDANQTFLSLFNNGNFVMRTRRDLGDQLGHEVRGSWSIKATQVILRSTQPNHPFQWYLDAKSHGNVFDLVPAELAEFYATASSNIGTRYRRYAGPSTNDLQVTPSATPAKKILKTGGSLVLQASTISRAPRPSSPPEVPVNRDPAVFVFRPAPTDDLDVRSLRGPGLARLSTDARGKVIAVTIIESTGRAQFDATAVDVLRRWRVRPGPPREIEVPLTTIMNGNRAPVRVPLTSGSINSG